MTQYKSDIKTISSPDEMVFNILSDLRNISRLQSDEQLQSKLKDLTFDTDSCSFVVDGIGKIGFRITERQPYSCIKLIAENSPIKISGEIVIEKKSEIESTLQLILDADIPMMLKMMLDKKLKEGINTLADLLAIALYTK